MKLILSTAAVLTLLTILAVIPLFAQEGPDENESYNNQCCDTLYEDQNLIRGEIGAYDDHDDWFTLVGTGIYTTLTLTFDPEEVEIDWEVIDDGRDPDYWDDRERRTLAYLDGYGSPESVTVDTFGHCEIHLWAYSGQGSYTVSIGDVNCQGFDEVEPNDGQNQADTIYVDAIEGTVCPGDSDWYMMDYPEGLYWSCTLMFDPSETEVDWEIYSGGERVAFGNGYGSPDTLSCFVPGKCYIHVWQFSGEGSYAIDTAGYSEADY